MSETGSILSHSGTAASVPEMVADSSKRGSESQRQTRSSRKSWELDSLLKDAGGEPEDDLVPKWKKYAKLILPHVGLILLSCIYIAIGALVFYHIERPFEHNQRRLRVANITSLKIRFLESMWNNSKDGMEQEAWKQIGRTKMDDMTRTLFAAFDTHFVTSRSLKNNSNNEAEDRLWTYTTAIFFTTTLLTTIGYGNLVPATFEGRIFCICYGLFGVPLILITVADLGKFLSEHIIWLYGRYSDAKRKFRERLRRRFSKKESVKIEVIGAEGEVTEDVEEEKLGIYDYVSIPVTLVLIILVGYTALGALLLHLVEGWPFFNSFYFSFITMTTVGFGDLVPEREAYLLLDLLYIIVGLAITTMCIDLVGIQYIRKIHYFGRAIQDARYALVNVGGKMVHVGDLMRYAQFLHRKYGLNEAHAHIIENPLARMFPHAYIPDDIGIIRYIDYIGGSSQSLFHLPQTENNNYQLTELPTEIDNIALTTISNTNATIQSPSKKKEATKKRWKMTKQR